MNDNEAGRIIPLYERRIMAALKPIQISGWLKDANDNLIH
jgi:hypothetical protein